MTPRAPGGSAGGAPGHGAQHLGDAQAELLVDDDDLAPRDRAAVDQQVDRLARHAVQRDDGARAESERVADRHARAADLDGELDGHAVEAGEVGVARRARRVRDRLERAAGVDREVDVDRRTRGGGGLGERLVGDGGFHDALLYCTATSVKRTSSTLTSVFFLIDRSSRDLSLSRPFSDTRLSAEPSVSESVTRSRITASCGSVPKPSGGLVSSPSATVAWLWSSTSPTLSFAKRPPLKLMRNSFGRT